MRKAWSPATVLSSIALFFALGGSGFALSEALDAPQARCGAGGVRGVASVTGAAGAGVGNVGDQFTSKRGVFARSFNCAGKAVQVRRAAFGSYEVRFVGVATESAVASAGAALATVQPLGGGTFRVTLSVPGRDDEIDTPFVVIAF
jgi:hypothetical protein